MNQKQSTNADKCLTCFDWKTSKIVRKESENHLLVSEEVASRTAVTYEDDHNDEGND